MPRDPSNSMPARRSGVYEDASLYPEYTAVLVVDGTGVVLLEAKIRTALLTSGLRKQIWRWLRANDNSPPPSLRIVS